MGVSHIALAVKDIEATHRFYTEAMGFELVKVEINPQKGGFARHVFYSTGSSKDQLIAFWDLSNVPGSGSWSAAFRLDLTPLTTWILSSSDSCFGLDCGGSSAHEEKITPIATGSSRRRR